MLVTDLHGQTEMLTDYNNLGIKRKVNGDYSISFDLISTDRNEHSFPLVQEESIIEYDTQQFRIKGLVERPIGDKSIKSISAPHIFFDLIDDFQYDTITGSKTINEVATFIFQVTDFTFDIIDVFDSITLDNFGNSNCLQLFNDLLNKFEAEFEVDNKHITIKQQIGRITDTQFRYKHNLKTIERNIDTNNLSTYIKGTGAFIVDSEITDSDGNIIDQTGHTVTAEYTSPLASIYGIRHAAPINDDKFTDQAALLAYITSQVLDTPNISFKVEVVNLVKAGWTLENYELGDEIYVIYEPLGIDIVARIIELDTNPESPQNDSITLSNYKPSVTDILADFGRTKQTVDGLIDGTKKIHYNALDEAVQRATVALNNSLTELEFPMGRGIIARDPNDANRFVAFRSNGIGITTDGGQTFKEAITADGFVLSAGVIGQLKAMNIDASNLQVSAANILGQLVASQINTIGLTSGQLITRNNNGYIIATIQQETLGGQIRIFDEYGQLNAVLGSEGGTGDNKGGTLILYDDGSSDASKRVETGISKYYSAGILNLRDSAGVVRIALAAMSNLGKPFIGILDATGTMRTKIYDDAIYIDNYKAATELYVIQYISGLGYATQAWVQSQGYSTGSSNSFSTIYANDIYTNATNIYLRTWGSVRVKDPGDGSYMPIAASAFTVSSNAVYKKNIVDYSGDALSEILTTPIREFNYTNENDNEMKHVGVILQESPVEIADIRGEGVDVYAMASMAWRGLQQEDDKVVKLKEENNLLTQRVTDLEQTISNLEQRLLALESK